MYRLGVVGGINVRYVIFTLVYPQKHSLLVITLWYEERGALRVAPSRNPASSAVALVVVLGSRNAELLPTRTLIIRGPTAFRRAAMVLRVRVGL